VIGRRRLVTSGGRVHDAGGHAAARALAVAESEGREGWNGESGGGPAAAKRRVGRSSGGGAVGWGGLVWPMLRCSMEVVTWYGVCYLPVQQWCS
jgi:hypothetical protein